MQSFVPILRLQVQVKLVKEEKKNFFLLSSSKTQKARRIQLFLGIKFLVSVRERNEAAMWGSATGWLGLGQVFPGA